MPIYEYRCRDCRRVSSFLILRVNEPFTAVCKHCHSPSMERLLSRVNVRLSEESRLERLADPALWGGVDENDPKSMARMLKKFGQEMGEDFPGEVDQMVEEGMDSQAAEDTGGAGEPEF
jgi:putative FmdB family regulatory protein